MVKVDIVLIKQCSIPEFMTSTLAEMLAGGNITRHNSVLYLPAKDIEIECEEEIESDLDGELGPKLPLKITTLAGKIKLFYEK